MPLQAPRSSALTSPVFFGLRLDSSAVCTPELLREHLQTVRQTLQCDFIVIPTAADSSLPASEASSLEKSRKAVNKLAAASRPGPPALLSTTSCDTPPSSGPHTVRSHACNDTKCCVVEDAPSALYLSEKDDASPTAPPEEAGSVPLLPSQISSSTSNGSPGHVCEGQKCQNSSPFSVAPAGAAAESALLVETPPFATGRATIPVHHLAAAAVDFPVFCRDNGLVSVHSAAGSAAVKEREACCGKGEGTSSGRPRRRQGGPSFSALDGGLAASPALYAFSPSTESDLALDSQTWNAAVVCELSSWISPDLGVLPGRRRAALTCSRAPHSDRGATRACPGAHHESEAAAAAAADVSSPSLSSTAAAADVCPVVTCCAATFPPSTAAAAHNSDHSDEPTAAGFAGGEEKACCCHPLGRGMPTCTAVSTCTTVGPACQPSQSKDELEGPEQQTHNSKRSRTVPRSSAGAPTQVTRTTAAADQQHCPCIHTHDQLQNWATPCSTEAAGGSSPDGLEKGRSSTDSGEAASASAALSGGAAARTGELPAVGDPALASSEWALSCPAAATSSRNDASEGHASSMLSSVAGCFKFRRRRHLLAPRKDEQAQLKRGLLRHWSFHESAWQREMQWATHVGAFAVITPPPAPDFIPVEYSRLLRAALCQLQPPIVWVKLPLVYNGGSSSRSSEKPTRRRPRSSTSSFSSLSSYGESHSESSSCSAEGAHISRNDTDAKQRQERRKSSSRFSSSKQGRRGGGRRENAPWQIWQYIRSMVGPHPALGICLEITPDLPDSDSELERWFAEPLRAVVLSPSLFISSRSAGSTTSTTPANSVNQALDGMCGSSQQPGEMETRDSGRHTVASRAAGGRRSAAADEPGVCLSPRHHLFLMKCAQHGVKIIFRFDGDEKEEQHDELGLRQRQQPLGLAGSPVIAAGSVMRGAKEAAEGNQGQSEPAKSRRYTERRAVDAREAEPQSRPREDMLTQDDFPPLLFGAACPTTRAVAGRGSPAAETPEKLSKKSAFCARGASAAHGGEEEGVRDNPCTCLQLEEMQPYITYVAQQLLKLPALKQTELFSVPYRDLLQSPMQPLADNLSAGNYEVFEKDPVKYIRYKEATLLRLREIWPGASDKRQLQQHRARGLDDAPQEVKPPASPPQGLTEQLQEQQQPDESKMGRKEADGADTSGSCTGHTSAAAETQRKRKKNRFRRRNRHTGRTRAHWWDYDSDEAEESAGEHETVPASTRATSSSAASSYTSAASISPSCSGFAGYPPYSSTTSTSVTARDRCSTSPSEWCLRGAHCTLHSEAGPPLVLTIVGAGRGPLVQAALEALQEAGIPLCRTRVFAVEKNWNAVITLRSRVRSDTCIGWRAVEVVEADMREAGDRVAERADILISELLGSFGDNELSAECLDGAQMRLLKKNGVSIPSAYVSSLEPVSTHTLWQAIDSYNNPKQFECPYVVNMFAKYFPAKEGPQECFHYRHPHFLLPFEDDDAESGSSSSSSEGGDRSSSASCSDPRADGSRSRSSSSETGSDSRRKLAATRRAKVSCASGSVTRLRENGAVGPGAGVRWTQGRHSDGDTYKRHEAYAGGGTSESVHVKEAVNSGSQKYEKAADAETVELPDARAHVAAAGDTAASAGGKDENTRVIEGGAGCSDTSRKAPARGADLLPVKVEKKKNRASCRERCGISAAELTALRHRRTRLTWHMRTDALVHGLAGYFHCCLYKRVYISIDPRSFSEGMFSWFPLFFPFREPVFVRRNEKLEVYIARDGDEHKVWYEWAVLQPTTSEIYNHMGRHSYIGK